MLTESGRVIALEADGLWVETIRQSTCGSCAVKQGCGHGLLNRMSDGKRGYIRVLPGEHAVEDFEVDDQVLISIPEEIVLRGSFIAYVLPVLGMLLGATGAVSWLPGNSDLLAFIGAVAGFSLGLLLVRWHGVRHRHDPRFQPVLQGLAQPPLEPVSIS